MFLEIWEGVEDAALFKKGGALYKSGATIQNHVEIINSISKRISKQAENIPTRKLITQTIMKQKMTLSKAFPGGIIVRDVPSQQYQFMVDVLSEIEAKLQPQWVICSDIVVVLED